MNTNQIGLYVFTYVVYNEGEKMLKTKLGATGNIENRMDLHYSRYSNIEFNFERDLIELENINLAFAIEAITKIEMIKYCKLKQINFDQGKEEYWPGNFKGIIKAKFRTIINYYQNNNELIEYANTCPANIKSLRSIGYLQKNIYAEYSAGLKLGF